MWEVLVVAGGVEKGATSFPAAAAAVAQAMEGVEPLPWRPPGQNGGEEEAHHPSHTEQQEAGDAGTELKDATPAIHSSQDVPPLAYPHIVEEGFAPGEASPWLGHGLPLLL